MLLSKNCPLFLNTCFLTRKVTEVIQFSTTNLTDFVDNDAVNGRRLDGENTLNTYSAGHFANSETLLLSVTGNFDNYSAVELDTLFCSLDNFVSNGNSVSALKLWKFFACCKCFFSNFN